MKFSGTREAARSKGTFGKIDEVGLGHEVLDLRARAGQLGHVDPRGHRLLAMERLSRRRDRGLGQARDGQFAHQSMHGSQNPGRARLDRGRRDDERQGRPGQHPDQKAGPDSGQLHGLRGVRRAHLGVGLHEDEEAKVDREEGSTAFVQSASVHVLQAFLVAKRRQSRQRVSQFYQ